MTKFITIRCILVIEATIAWEIHQMNLKAAFFNGVLEMEIYMNQPECFIQEGKKNLMCNLKKILYRLKQLPKTWYHRIESFFINEGFCKSQADHLL